MKMKSRSFFSFCATNPVSMDEVQKCNGGIL